MWIAVLLGLTLSAQAPGAAELNAANAHYVQQKYRLAAELYEAAIALDPSVTSAYFYAGKCYDNLYHPARRGEPDNDANLVKAETWYRRALDQSADPALRRRSLRHLAEIYSVHKLNAPARAVPILRQLIALDPKDLSGYTGLSTIHEDAGQFDAAEATLIEASEAILESTAPLAALGAYYNRRNDFERAMAVYEQICEREPTEPTHYYHLAVRYEEKARKDYRLSPAQRDAYATRGLAAVDAALELRSDYVEAVIYRGLLLRQLALGEPDPARRQATLDEASEMQRRAIEIRNHRAKVGR
jgi:tetratricopeptide (TPR) repeat protein